MERSSGSSTRVPRNVFAQRVSVMGIESSFMAGPVRLFAYR
jgi:hypothetical protein